MDVKRLLWPTDFSENAAQALPVATSLAQKYQAEINIVLLGRGSHLAFRFELRPAVTDERPHIGLLGNRFGLIIIHEHASAINEIFDTLIDGGRHEIHRTF